ncbi:unnamed protein product [Rotaria magnacalcarata]|uniref:Uncharacterized protein n=1 Tax=Rotaria magnacalcarata TaxID=392030 RepID=A0A816N3D1_9BILA|nr:unnamed protein product [Rotaria magnacalcarata]
MYTIDLTKDDMPNILCITLKYSLFFILFYVGTLINTPFDESDLSIQVITWSNDGQSLFLELSQNGNHAIFKAVHILISNETVLWSVVDTGTWHDINLHPNDSQILLATHDNFIQPTNIVLRQSDIKIPITKHNDQLIKKSHFSYNYDEFTFFGAQNKTIHGWHLLSVNSTEKKAPIAFSNLWWPTK